MVNEIMNWLKKHFKKFSKAMDPYVFIPAALLVVAFVVIGSIYPKKVYESFSYTQNFISIYMGWFYILLILGLLILSLYFALSKWGKIKLGPDDSKPEHSRFAWLSMLFSAGMGTGLVFWSVAEPLSHFNTAPPTIGPISSHEASMAYTYFHWGLHPWAIYAVFALGIAYFHFRLKQPLAPRSLLYPFLGSNVNNFIGRTFDTICVVGTLFGVATSLGLGAMQINSGIQEFADVQQSTNIQIMIVLVITFIATISVVSGIDKGIKRLSQTNIVLVFLLTALVFILGPSLDIIKNFISSLGIYIQYLPRLSTQIGSGETLEWQKSWTLFYWGWWISWSPFVGIFVARISKGRTVREFLISVLLIPTLGTFLLLSIYGETAFFFEASQSAFPMQDIISEPARGLHMLLSYLPIANILSVLATLLIIIFFVTSSDSGSLVDDMITSGGHPNPPKIQRVFWATAEGLTAMTLLLSGGLKALQMVSISAGLPMSMILFVTAYGLIKEKSKSSINRKK